MKIARSTVFLCAVMLSVTISGCGMLHREFAAWQTPSDFVELASDKRVRYESGSEGLAREIAVYLPEAVATVEREQYRPFASPIEIYICASPDSFASHTGISKVVRGFTNSRGRIFLSPILQSAEHRGTARMVLTHELTHAHLFQQVGLYRYGRRSPFWFREGLAVAVSRGGGAEKVSEEEAARAIASGKQLAPETGGSFSFDFQGMQPAMFYRQAGMFVQYLRQLDEKKFQTLLLSLEDGGSLEESLANSFGMSIESAWLNFVQEVVSKTKATTSS